MERFWSKVRIGEVDECWPWTAFVRPDGYGAFRVAGGAKIGPPGGLDFDPW